MGTLHLAVNVLALFWETPRLLKLKKVISFSRGRTLSGHTWSTARKFSILNLSSLHPYGKPCLDHTARLWSTMLSNCSTTHHSGRIMSFTARLCLHLLGQAQDSVAQWIQGARGLAVGGTTPDTHGRLHGLAARCGPAHKTKAYGARYCSACTARYQGRYPEDATRSVRICSIP